MIRRSVLGLATAALMGAAGLTGCGDSVSTGTAAEPRTEKSFGERAMFPASGPNAPKDKTGKPAPAPAGGAAPAAPGGLAPR